MSRRRRGRVLLAAGVAVAAAGGTAAAVALDRGDSGTAAGSTLPPATAQVQRSTLVDAETVDGTLGYGTETAVTPRLRGTVTWLPPAGSTIKRGGRLYGVDDTPVVLLRGTLPLYRPLTPGVEGADVKQFEQNLAALGYDGFTVDEEYSDSTADAVREWQEDLGIEQTGTVEVGRVAYAAGDVRIYEVRGQVGDPAGGQAVLSYTGTTRVVTVDLDVDQQRLAGTGAAVGVELPDGRTAQGKVASVETVIELGSGGTGQEQEPETKLEVTVSLADQKGLGTLDQAAVDVSFTAQKRENVLSVPVAALLALAEGGYGVQVVEGTTTRIVPVETGMFSGGRVEVSGDGVAEGMTVGVAS
ncbi:peptidoglycan-binding protein [Phytohabitans sp. ZYX-F-186]|uniref:Peptidoglycan-binding protein n=1 Tax=Phytohabitans maris TaxID=3071409 RepID=A0ABU0ZGP6_9ACTN|nr:peptidoglycan-binding protein [Phytohabitans sp. ZYX-F-186]MDQ7906222.1 peptidoglycan-binding protein [Phytohabitans sp. ZYX-F-186]